MSTCFAATLSPLLVNIALPATNMHSHSCSGSTAGSENRRE